MFEGVTGEHGWSSWEIVLARRSGVVEFVRTTRNSTIWKEDGSRRGRGRSPGLLPEMVLANRCENGGVGYRNRRLASDQKREMMVVL
jgi:hypothetical protein